MTPFAKLDSGIIDSSVWAEKYPTRIVWITMLAKKDHRGFVGASKSGLARSANVTIEECEAALVVLESPDKDSRTPDNDGRRIERVDGGWIVLNHAKYRDYSHADTPGAIRAKRYRDNKRDASRPSRSSRDGSVSGSGSGSGSGEEESERKGAARFVPPTVEDVRAYCDERKNGIDAEKFVAYYAARKWKPKGYTQQMSDWKSAVITWEKNQKDRGEKSQQQVLADWVKGGTK